jgi:hypothetical protein
LYPLRELFIHMSEESPRECRVFQAAKSRIMPTSVVPVCVHSLESCHQL